MQKLSVSLTIYRYTKAIVAADVQEKSGKKYIYPVNFTTDFHICKDFPHRSVFTSCPFIIYIVINGLRMFKLAQGQIGQHLFGADRFVLYLLRLHANPAYWCALQRTPQLFQLENFMQI